MQPRIKLAIKILAVVLVIVLTSFVTKKSESWFKPTTEIVIVFEDSRFAGIPTVTAVKDKTTYKFLGCDFTNRKFGETITPSEVDEAIEKLERGKK